MLNPPRRFELAVMGVAASTPAPKVEIFTPMPRRENGLSASFCAEHIFGSTRRLANTKARANKKGCFIWTPTPGRMCPAASFSPDIFVKILAAGAMAFNQNSHPAERILSLCVPKWKITMEDDPRELLALKPIAIRT